MTGCFTESFADIKWTLIVATQTAGGARAHHTTLGTYYIASSISVQGIILSINWRSASTGHGVYHFDAFIRSLSPCVIVYKRRTQRNAPN